MKYVISLLLLLFAATAQADEVRCGTHVIDPNQDVPLTEDDVLELCGEPDERGMDNWVYGQEGQVRQVLHFEDGRLVGAHEQSP
jgi:hypothetical protein